MTENDIVRCHAPRLADPAEPTTLHPRRRDVHRSGTARRRTDARRTAVPAALTAVALSAGLATGVAAAASGSSDAVPAAGTAATPAAGDGVSLVTTTADGSAAASQEVSSAQAALARARTVAHDSTALSDEQRDKIARKADRLRTLVTGQEPASRDRDATASSAGPKASRSAERVPVADRARDGNGDSAAAEQDDTSDGPTRDLANQDVADHDVADQDVADQGVAAVAVGNAITHPTLLSDAGSALTDREASAGTTGTAATGSGPGGGKLATAPASSEKLASATESLTALIDDAQSSPVEIETAPATPAEILTAQVQAAREAAPTLAKHAGDTRGYENGRIPTGDLCEPPFAAGETMRCDAAEQLERLNTAYRARFGTNLQIRDSYRSYESQVSVKASRGHFAAVPGYSDHGLAVAVDLNGGVEEFGSAQHAWLRDVAPKFGWDNPGWAREDGRKPEAWHWEYTSR